MKNECKHRNNKTFSCYYVIIVVVNDVAVVVADVVAVVAACLHDCHQLKQDSRFNPLTKKNNHSCTRTLVVVVVVVVVVLCTVVDQSPDDREVLDSITATTNLFLKACRSKQTPASSEKELQDGFKKSYVTICL